MERLGGIFGVPTEEILRRSENGTMVDDVELLNHNDATGSGYRLTETQALYRVMTNVLEQLGIVRGGVLVVDTSPDEIANIQSGDIAIARLRTENNVATILRQFIEPSLLITNSSTKNQPIANLRTQDVGIKAVVISSHSTLRKNRVNQ
jgi:hypothetical protein